MAVASTLLASSKSQSEHKHMSLGMPQVSPELTGFPDVPDGRLVHHGILIHRYRSLPSKGHVGLQIHLEPKLSAPTLKR